MKQLWDISPTVSPASPIFPGDEPYALRWTAQLSPGCPVNLSALTMSPHVGAHADAPLHYGNGQPSAAEVDLQAYVGPCRVIHAIDCGPLIKIEHLLHVFNGLCSEQMFVHGFVWMRNAEPPIDVSYQSNVFTGYAPAWIPILSLCEITVPAMFEACSQAGSVVQGVEQLLERERKANAKP